MPASLDNLDDLLDSESAAMLVDPALVDAGGKITGTLWKAGCDAWGILLNRGVFYTEGQSTYIEPAGILGDEKGEMLVTDISWNGDRNGEFRIAIVALGAKGVISYMLALMMGTEANPEETKLGAEEMDAYKEAISQFCGSAAQALRGELKGNIKLEVKGTKLVNLEQEAPATVFGNESAYCASGQLTIEGMSPVSVFTIMPASLTGVSPNIPKTAQNTAEIAHPSKAAHAPGAADTARVMRLELPLSVILAERSMRLSDVMNLTPGSIIEFRKASEEMLDLCVGNTIIGVGEVVIKREHFGIQLRKMVPHKPAGK